MFDTEKEEGRKEKARKAERRVGKNENTNTEKKEGKP